MGAILSAADYTNGLDWRIFPVHSVIDGQCTCVLKCKCKSPGKHPRTRNGLKDATTDSKIIRKWQHRHPDSNIGILTGLESGIVAVDIDVGKGGLESFARLSKNYGSNIADTLTADTGGGGFHLIYQAPDLHIKNSQGAIDVGVDVRADGGYIVGSPSTHISGKKYTWRDGLYRPVSSSDTTRFQ